jgi:hypothetical protein
VPVNYIAKWNGTNWSALGSGVNGVPRLVASEHDLFALGGFTTAGGKISPGLARARIDALPRPGPEIVVEASAGVTLADGVSSVDFASPRR